MGLRSARFFDVFRAHGVLTSLAVYSRILERVEPELNSEKMEASPVRFRLPANK